MAVRRGYKQTPEHVAARFASNPRPNWKGDAAGIKAGRSRALKAFPVIPPCERCGAAESERHHRDENTLNNDPDNIRFLCRRCHMVEDGRLAALPAMVAARDTSGEANGNAKLSACDVSQIRALRADGASMRALASGFGVSANQIHRIVTYRAWPKQ